jgi:hypothetical protein
MADKNVAIDGELYDYIADQAKRNHRTIKGQIRYIIELVKSSDVDVSQTQVDLSALRDPSIAERVQ